MDYKIDWQDDAIEDLENIREYLEQFDFDVADKILEDIVNKTHKLTMFPNRCPKIDEDTDIRRLIVRDYYVFYFVVEENKIVRILHVFHHLKNTKILM